jgi:hypothetical protein
MFAPNESPSAAPSPDKIFLLDARNRAYLDQRANRPHFPSVGLPIPDLYVIIVLIFALFMTLVALQGGGEFLRWLVTTVAGITIRANVVDKQQVQSRPAAYEVKFAFTVNDQRYEVTQRVDKAAYDKANETVQVNYWSPNPQVARLSGEYEVSNMLINSLAQAGCSSIFVIVMLAIAVARLSKWRKSLARQWALRNDGRLLYGEIISATADESSRRGYLVTVHYSLTTPDGRTLKRKQLRTLNHLRGKPLPAKGTPVALLYADDKTIEML